jgi:hypothetical protein
MHSQTFRINHRVVLVLRCSPVGLNSERTQLSGFEETQGKGKWFLQVIGPTLPGPIDEGLSSAWLNVTALIITVKHSTLSLSLGLEARPSSPVGNSNGRNRSSETPVDS